MGLVSSVEKDEKAVPQSHPSPPQVVSAEVGTWNWEQNTESIELHFFPLLVTLFL